MSRSRYDWEAVERDYRTGRYSLSELSAMHGPAKQTIADRAKKHGWEKDLSAPVRQRTREKVVKGTLSPEALEALEGDDAAIVEEASNLNAAVAAGHRRQLTAWRTILDQYTERLTEQTARGTMSVKTRDGDVAEVDVPLDYVGKALGAGTQALERVVRMERESYGLDDDDGNEPAEARLTDDQVRRRIAELEAKRQGQP